MSDKPLIIPKLPMSPNNTAHSSDTAHTSLQCKSSRLSVYVAHTNASHSETPEERERRKKQRRHEEWVNTLKPELTSQSDTKFAELGEDMDTNKALLINMASNQAKPSDVPATLVSPPSSTTMAAPPAPPLVTPTAAPAAPSSRPPPEYLYLPTWADPWGGLKPTRIVSKEIRLRQVTADRDLKANRYIDPRDVNTANSVAAKMSGWPCICVADAYRQG
ncbi:hypothetical protein GGR57DRAFT_517752 [Xylariaceae sp. FL1272]|nr:hypothetical protein GGR57DRAFT_517752 [Xylariaceae sp. FL1272]